MKFKKISEKYGEVEYFESAWTGKKGLKIQGQPLMAVKKNTFLMKTTEGDVAVTLKGSYMTGVILNIAGEEIEIIEKPKWYITTLIIFFAVLPMIWANVPALCKIFPIVGGAIGGLIVAVCAVASYMVTHIQKKTLHKLLVIVAGFLVSVALLYAIGILFVMLIAK